MFYICNHVICKHFYFFLLYYYASFLVLSYCISLYFHYHVGKKWLETNTALFLFFVGRILFFRMLISLSVWKSIINFLVNLNLFFPFKIQNTYSFQRLKSSTIYFELFFLYIDSSNQIIIKMFTYFDFRHKVDVN